MEKRQEIRQMEAREHAPEGREKQGVRRAAVYCRVSTLQEEQEESFETQQRYYRRLIAQSPGLELAGVYGDQGVSGLTMSRRKDFQRMMEDCMAGKIDVVMTKSISRFARSLADCVGCIRQLRERGIAVLFEKESLNTLESSSEFVLSVLASMAQEEVNNLSRNVRWSLEHHNAVGDPVTKARYGYRRCKRDGRSEWIICEAEAQRVRLAFELARQGAKYKEILRQLNDWESREQTGRYWSQKMVYAMLKSETYIGDLLTNKTYSADLLSKRQVRNHGRRTQYYIKEHHAAIIGRETFCAVGERIRQNGLAACARR